MYKSTNVVDFDDVARRRRDAMQWDAIVLSSSGQPPALSCIRCSCSVLHVFITLELMADIRHRDFPFPVLHVF